MLNAMVVTAIVGACAVQVGNHFRATH